MLKSVVLFAAIDLFVGPLKLLICATISWSFSFVCSSVGCKALALSSS